MRVVPLLFFGLMMTLFVNAQTEEVILNGRILDKDLSTPIENASITVRSLSESVLSDEDGNFIIKLKPQLLTLRISHISYSNQVHELELSQNKGDTLYFEFFLAFDPVEIDVAEIVANPPPEVVYQSEEFHVHDFSFHEDRLILLTYSKEDRFKRQEDVDKTILENPVLVFYDDSNSEVIDRFPAEGAFGIYSDYLDEEFLLTYNGISHITLNNEGFELLEVKEEVFRDHIQPAFDTLDNKLIFSTWTSDFPAFDYIGYNLKDSAQSHIQHIEDKEQMSFLRSEYKYLSTRNKLNAYRLELKTGVDKEIIAAQMSGFAESQYFDPIYAPAFIIADSLVIFDHPDSKIRSYKSHNQEKDSVDIGYLENREIKHWKEQLLLDRANEKVYAVYQRNGYGYLKEVDIKTGKTLQSQRLYYRYPEGIKVHNGKIYYTYRPFGSAQKKYLYSEQVNTEKY